MAERSATLHFVLGVLTVAVGLGLWKLFSPAPPGPRPAAPEPPAAAAPAPEPAVRHPLPGEPPEAAMQAPATPPPEARAAFDGELPQVAPAEAIARFAGAGDLIRRIVSTVDNLASDSLPIAVRAVAPIPGRFAVRGPEGARELDVEANAARYEPFVRFAESIDARRAAQLYVRHYRLFQGELRGQGSPDRYFNDRVVASIDHLLATPVVDGPIRLVQPRVQYRFEDPALESLSAGQKAMIRIGPKNAARLKAVLRSMRAELARSQPGG